MCVVYLKYFCVHLYRQSHIHLLCAGAVYYYNITVLMTIKISFFFYQVLGTPTREQIREMNPNYTEFKFPQIKAHPWTKVCSHYIYAG